MARKGKNMAVVEKALEPGRTDPLTSHERKVVLRVQEGVIEEFLKKGLEAGQALSVIKNQELFRETIVNEVRCRDFETYCRLRWGMGRSHAEQLIAAAEAAPALARETGYAPSNEYQVRPLLYLFNRPSTRPKAFAAWRKANESTSKVTMRAVKQALHLVAPEEATRLKERARRRRRGEQEEEEVLSRNGSGAPAAPPVAAEERTSVDLVGMLRAVHGQLRQLVETLDLQNYEMESLSISQREQLAGEFETTARSLEEGAAILRQLVVN